MKWLLVQLIAVLLFCPSASMANSLHPGSGPDIGSIRNMHGRAAADIGDIDFLPFGVHKEADLLFRAATGDILPDRPGLEIASCSRNGIVSVTYGSDLSWTTETAWRSTVHDNPNDPAYVYSIAVGDLLPERPGDEIVTVDSDDSVELVWKEGEDWEHKTLFKDTMPASQMWMYEVAIGDIPGVQGTTNVLSVNDAGRTFGTAYVNGSWETTLIYSDPLALDSGIICDIVPEWPGNEMVVGGTGRNVTLVRWTGTYYTKENIAHTVSPVIDLVCTDLDPMNTGPEIFASTNAGDLIMVVRDGSGWSSRTVHTEGNTIYGIEPGTIDGTPVLSLASWNNRICLLYFDEGFKVREIHREDFLMMGTWIADIDPYHKGNEVLALSFYGKMTMLYHDDPGPDLLLPFQECIVSLGESVSVPLILRSKGGYEGETTLQVSSGTGATLSSDLMLEEGIIRLDFESPNRPTNVTVQVTASTMVGALSREIVFRVRSESGKLDFEEHAEKASVGADRQVGGRVVVLSDRDMGSPFVLGAEKVPRGLTLDLSNSVCDPLGTPIPLDYVLRAEPWLSPGTYLFFLKGTLADGRERAVGFEVNVTESSFSDFMLYFEADSFTVSEGGNGTIGVQVQSVSGFLEEVILELPEETQGVGLRLSKTSVIPTERVELTIEVLGGQGPYFITLKGKSGGLVREDIIRVDTLPPDKTIGLQVQSTPVSMHKKDGAFEATFEVRLTPINGPVTIGTISIDGLTEGLSASVSPSGLETVPYPVNLTIRISSSRNLDGPVTVKLSVAIDEATGNESVNATIGPWVGEEREDSGRVPIFAVVLLVTVAGIISGVFILLLVRRKVSEHVEGKPQRRVVRAHLHHRDGQTAERPHGRYRSPGRMDGR